MKVELTDEGTLIVMPENGTESFALKKWVEHSELIMHEKAIEPHTGIFIDTEIKQVEK